MRYFLSILLIFPMFCMAQNIPKASNPVPVYNHPKRSKIPDNQIESYKYVWYIIYPDHIIESVRQAGYNQPKEVGPFTEEVCMGAVQDCSQEGLKVGYSKRLNPRYNPPENGSAKLSDQADHSQEAEYTYDPLQDAINHASQNQIKAVNNDPNVVDLSGLKDSYSAKVNPLELKSPAQINTSKEKCQEALVYAANRISALKQMINNSGKLLEQQNKTIVTAENEVKNWEETLLENKFRIAQGLTDVAIDNLGEMSSNKFNKQIKELDAVKESAQKTGKIATLEVSTGMLEETQKKATFFKNVSSGYGGFENSVNTSCYMVDTYKKGEIDMNTLADGYLSVMNAVDLLNIPVLKPIHYALLYTPLAADIAFREGAYKPMSQQAKSNLDRTRLDFDILKSKIESWKEELNEYQNCGNNCDLIRRVMIRRRPDLR
ncbi:MAG: hypothetical protein M0P26_02140 [Bacteroidales bacterium]|nr:hypothetical protein [Bacteroidales bacterium]